MISGDDHARDHDGAQGPAVGDHVAEHRMLTITVVASPAATLNGELLPTHVVFVDVVAVMETV